MGSFVSCAHIENKSDHTETYPKNTIRIILITPPPTNISEVDIQEYDEIGDIDFGWLYEECKILNE